MPDRPSEASDATSRPASDGRPLLIFAVLGIVLVVASILFGRTYYYQQRAIIQEHQQQELAAIGKLKVDQIVRWRDGLAKEGLRYASDPNTVPHVQEWARTGSEADAAAVIRYLAYKAEFSEATAIAYVDVASGRAVYAGTLAGGQERLLEAARKADPDAPRISDPYKAGSSVYVDMTAPVSGSSADTSFLVMQVDLRKFLYPLLQSWPIPSDTAETLLVRRVGDKVLYLNDTRFAKDNELSLTVAASQSNVLAVQAVQGRLGVRTGVDYRGVAVLGALQHVPGTDWFLIAKQDETEAYAEMRAAAVNAIIGVVLLVLVVSAGIGAAWRTQVADQYRRRLLLEQEHNRLAEKYQYLSRYANDVVLMTDAAGRVLEFNDRATDLYGYSHEELLGMTVADLRSPAARPKAADTISRLLAAGHLLYETEHVRKDGTPFMVETSARVIGEPGSQQIVAVMRDITERKAQEQELEAYRQHLEALVEDRTQELASSNEELQSANEEQVATNEELQSVNEELAATNEELHTTNDEIQAVNEELASTNEDLAVTTEELADANRELRIATRAKSEFLANMSHELRTPLNSIIGFTGIMLQGLTGRLTKEQRSQLAMVRRSGDRLLALINDILDLSRIEAGRTVMSAMDVDLGAVTRACVETVRPLATERGLSIAIEGMPNDTLLHTDEQKLHQVLVNLLANAVKFTDAGGVTLAAEDADESVVFEVRDTGVGIAPEDLAAIFDEFVQIGRDGGKPDGTGLGLAISRRLADLLGGTLTASSVVGQGSTFRLTIPRAP